MNSLRKLAIYLLLSITITTTVENVLPHIPETEIIYEPGNGPVMPNGDGGESGDEES